MSCVEKRTCVKSSTNSRFMTDPSKEQPLVSPDAKTINPPGATAKPKGERCRGRARRWNDVRGRTRRQSYVWQAGITTSMVEPRGGAKQRLTSCREWMRHPWWNQSPVQHPRVGQEYDVWGCDRNWEKSRLWCRHMYGYEFRSKFRFRQELRHELGLRFLLHLRLKHTLGHGFEASSNRHFHLGWVLKSIYLNFSHWRRIWSGRLYLGHWRGIWGYSIWFGHERGLWRDSLCFGHWGSLEWSSPSGLLERTLACSLLSQPAILDCWLSSVAGWIAPDWPQGLSVWSVDLFIEEKYENIKKCHLWKTKKILWVGDLQAVSEGSEGWIMGYSSKRSYLFPLLSANNSNLRLWTKAHPN